MRRLVDAERLRAFMRALGSRTDAETTCYLAGGATAVLVGWRDATIDVDVLFAPESDPLLRAIPELKEELELNVELAFPGDFVPLPAGWEERSSVRRARRNGDVPQCRLLRPGSRRSSSADTTAISQTWRR